MDDTLSDRKSAVAQTAVTQALLGMACEVASPGELAQATAAGFAPDRIVFDSPAKTRGEIATVLRHGMTLNIDNFQELDRVDAAMRALGGSRAVIGMRINPQVGVGTIAAMSTATRTSKFGHSTRGSRQPPADHRRLPRPALAHLCAYPCRLAALPARADRRRHRATRSTLRLLPSYR